MTWFPYRRQAAWDSTGAAVNAGVGQVYAVDDIVPSTGAVKPGAVPLVAREIGGGPVMATVPIVDFLSLEFEVENHEEVYWKSGTLPPVNLISAGGMRAATLAAAAAAVSAASSASTSAVAAAEAAGAVLSGGDTTTSTLLNDPDSLTRAAAIEVAATLAPSGTYADRPDANEVPAGTVYRATDVPEEYLSDGSAWSVVGRGGTEIGYAQSLTAFGRSEVGAIDVTGLTTTFMVGERPIEVRFDGDVAGYAIEIFLVVDGVSRAHWTGPSQPSYLTVSRRVRVPGLTPGTVHTAKIQIRSQANGQNAVVAGDTATPMSISVVTL